MAQFSVTILSALTLVSNLSGSLGNLNFTNILSKSIEKESNLASCLLTVIRDTSPDFISNIGIGIETESSSFRRDFMDLLDGLSALNDKVTINYGSSEERTVSIDAWLNLIDSVNSLELLIKHQRNTTDNISVAEQNYIIILPVNVPYPERMVQQIFELCWNNSILNVNVFFEDSSGTITLYTYYPFSERGCRNTTPKIHNRFFKGQFEQNITTFPPKARNLWQCPIRMIVYSDPPFMILNENKISGPNIYILETLARLMNFSLEILICSKKRGSVDSSGTSTGCLRSLVNGLGDLMVATSTKQRLKVFAGTIEFHFFNWFPVVKRSKLYSPLEVLLFPFDWYTWMAICTFVVGKWISQLLHRRISYGPVYLSVTFKRFALTLWLFGILVLSSTYGGSIFSFLQNRPLKDPPKSIHEAFVEGYKFIVSQSSMGYIKNAPELRDHIIAFGDTDEEALQHFDNLKGTYGFINYKEFLYSAVDIESHGEFFLIEEPIVLNYICIYMAKFSYLTKDFNRHLRHMITHGHVYNTYRHLFPSEHPIKRPDVKPKSITFHELIGQFKLLAILTVISFGIFLLELLSRYSRSLRKILDFFH